jgi:hypothetical protein
VSLRPGLRRVVTDEWVADFGRRFLFAHRAHRFADELNAGDHPRPVEYRPERRGRWWHIVAYQALLIPVGTAETASDDFAETARQHGRTEAAMDAAERVLRFFERKPPDGAHGSPPVWMIDAGDLDELVDAVKKAGRG